MAFRSAGVRGEPLGRLITEPALRANPHPLYDELRERPVVAGRVVSVTARHDVVSACLRDPDLLSGFPFELLPGPLRLLFALAEDRGVADPITRPSMVATNGPEHDSYRRLAMRAFSPRAVENMRAHVEHIANELLEAMAASAVPGKPSDVVLEYAELLPVMVIAEILGVPLEMRPSFRQWATEIVAAAEMGVGYGPFRRAEHAGRQLFDWMLEHQRNLRRNPGSDLFSRMIIAADEQREGHRASAVDERGLVINGALLLFAGFETTVNLIGSGVELLLRHQRQLAALKERPEGWANAVEETLRFAPPLENSFRYPAHDLELEGVAMRRGHFLALLIGGANRDPGVFADPHRFDVTRPNARDHLSFGAGSHYCLGAALARIEGEIGLRTLFTRFPELSVAAASQRRPTRMISGIARLPVWLEPPDGSDRP